MERFGVMAAHGNKFIRLRLFFDYPPPAVVGCRMCWLLVDLNTCRVVADLESVIREKFEFSRSNILSLFIEDCYLPHTESIYVVRDNDNVRVKVECLPQVNGHSSCPETAAVSCKKRRRDTAEGQSLEHNKKKKKKRNELEDRTADGSDVAKGDNGNTMLEIKMAAKKKKKKKKKRIVKSVDRRHPAVPEAAAASDIPSGPDKTPAGKVKTQNGPSSGPSRNGNEDCHQKVAKKPSASPAASKGAPHQKPSPEKSQPSSSSASSQTDSSSDVADTLKVPARTKPLHPDTSSSKAGAQNQNQTSSTEQPPLNQDSEEEIQLVIRQPQQPFLNIPVPGAWRGLGRGRDRRWAGGDPGECPRVRGQSDVERFGNGTKEPSYQTDSLSNKSVVLQTEAEPVPKDYSSMPLLAAPPQVGQKIAFKLLELTENYTPEVSEYKEGKIINFDPTTKQIELELLNASQVPAEPGKFDLVYQNPDGSERVEYAIQRGSSIMERWDSLLEPRLII